MFCGYDFHLRLSLSFYVGVEDNLGGDAQQ